MRKALSAFVVAIALAGVGSAVATAATIKAQYPAWNPNAATINVGESVTFENPEGIAHGVRFNSPPAAPTCTAGVPVESSGANWSGSCTFNQAGSYAFVCTVHPQMTGTITVNGGPEAPSVTTKAATSVTETGATLNGEVNPHGQATTYWFKWGTGETYGHESAAHESLGFTDSGFHSKSEAIAGLSPETTYQFKMVANNGTGTTEGSPQTFRTPGPATATTKPATGVGGVEATLVGLVNPNGQPSAKYFFNWGTTEAYGHKTTEKSVAGTTPASKTELVTGLSPNTAYHFQIVVKYGATEVKGLDETFTTLNIPAPMAMTGQAAAVSEASATLEGVVNPQGRQTGYHFNYGTTTAYGQETAEKFAGSGTADVGVSEPLTGLSPSTTYHFQLVARNAGGTSPGADQTFTTAATPPPPPPTLAPPSPFVPETAAPPDTKITLKPAAKTQDRTPTIRFRATGGGASFLCSVDSKPFKACRSPFTTPALKPGRHRIRVKAVVAGVADPTPASVSFKVLAVK